MSITLQRSRSSTTSVGRQASGGFRGLLFQCGDMSGDVGCCGLLLRWLLLPQLGGRLCKCDSASRRARLRRAITCLLLSLASASTSSVSTLGFGSWLSRQDRPGVAAAAHNRITFSECLGSWTGRVGVGCCSIHWHLFAWPCNCLP